MPNASVWTSTTSTSHSQTAESRLGLVSHGEERHTACPCALPAALCVMQALDIAETLIKSGTVDCVVRV